MPPTAMPQDHKKKATKPRAASKKEIPATVAPAVMIGTGDRYAPTTWGNNTGVEDLVVPSGQTCLVKRPGVQRMIEAGVLRDIDSLSAIVAETHIKRVKGDDGVERADIDTESLASDVKAINDVLSVVDRVVVHCVVRPEVVLQPDGSEPRLDGVIYTDMIDIEDKMFIFNFAVGGTRSVERFREESIALVGGLDIEQAVANQAEQDVLPGG